MSAPFEGPSPPHAALFRPLVSLVWDSVVGYDVCGDGHVAETTGDDAADGAGRLATGTPDGGATHLILRHDRTHVSPASQPFEEEWLWFARRIGAQVVLEVAAEHRIGELRDLLHVVAWARERDVRIALDVSTAIPDALGLLPLLVPDLVRLSATALRSGDVTSPSVDAILSFCDHRSATLIVDGIDTDRDRTAAVRAGATLGQGALFGQPTRSPVWSAPDTVAPRATPSPPSDRLSRPSDLTARAGTAVLPYRTVVGRIHEIIGEAGRCDPGHLLVSVQNEDLFIRHFGKYYPGFVSRHRLVGVLGAPRLTIPGLHSYTDRPGFAGEFGMALLTPSRAVSLAAVDMGDDGPPAERRYEWSTSTDRTLAGAVAAVIARQLFS